MLLFFCILLDRYVPKYNIVYATSLNTDFPANIEYKYYSTINRNISMFELTTPSILHNKFNSHNCNTIHEKCL